MIDYSQSRDALDWVAERLGVNFRLTEATWLTARGQHGSILGVAIFSRFAQGNCEVTVVLRDTFLPRNLLLHSVAYVFGQLKCRRATAFIAVDNAKSLSAAQRLGFRIEGTCKQWFPSGDAHVLGILREDCIYFKDLADGQPQRTPST